MPVVNRNLNRRILQALYMLKRQYGGSIAIYKKGTQTTDYDTGNKTIVKEVYPIRRAIILPVKVAREAVQTISVISANKAFVVGADYDAGTRMFIVDRRDEANLPELTENDWIVYQNRKYEIQKFEMFEFDSAYVIIGRVIYGDTPEQIYPLCADNLLRINDASIGSV